MTIDGRFSTAVRTRCSAKSSRTGERCRRWPIAGGTVCPMHGGRAPQAKAAAARRVAAAEALRLAEPFGKPDEIGVEPTVVLQRELDRQASVVGRLHLVVEQLDPESALFGPAKAVVDTLTAQQGKLTGLATDMVRLGIEARSARLVEATSAAMVQLLARLVDGLGLRPSQREQAQVIVVTSMRELAEVVDRA